MSKRYQGFAAAREERLLPPGPPPPPPISSSSFSTARSLEPVRSAPSFPGPASTSSGSMLPDFFTQIMTNHGDNLQQMALLAYLKNEEMGKPMLEAITTAKVCHTLFKHLSKEDEIEAARTETILRIAAYVKAHPHARPHEIRAKVDDEINLFKVKLQNI